ncbi:MAG: sigma-54-dependent transcriptional regulator [Paracoccaceae bacterium]
MNNRVLLIEDTPSLSMVYENLLKKSGYEVECAFDAATAMAAYEATRHKIVLLDLLLPDGNGLDILKHVIGQDGEAKVIVITANGSINRAVEAMRAGAFEFLVKPFDRNRLLSAVTNARQGLAANGGGRKRRAGRKIAVAEHFIGSSPAMRGIYRMIESIGRSAATVFVTGESGTGKEICAKEIHAVSNRRDGPFVPLNCGAIPADLLESEVFGHLKGSFTGAIADKPGAAAAAHGGTLFLDEICEMDLALQTKLLRFLQTSMIQPVGSTAPQMVDARIICATNRNPEEEVSQGRFREDLYYRLHVVPVHLPPLRDRGEDVIEIAESMLAKFAAEEGKGFRSLSPEVKEIFRRSRWPGNVRQLLNILRNVVVLNDGSEVQAAMLPAGFASDPEPSGPVEGRRAEARGAGDRGLRRAAPDRLDGDQNAAVQSLVGLSLSRLERAFIRATVEDCDGSIPQAARRLGLSASTLYRKFENWERKDD